MRKILKIIIILVILLVGLYLILKYLNFDPDEIVKAIKLDNYNIIF